MLQRLERIALSSGACLFGVAELDDGLRSRIVGLDDRVTGQLTRAIAIASPVPDSVLESLSDGPTQLYFYIYRKINSLLDHIALKLCTEIADCGGRSLPVPSSQIVDWDKRVGLFSHRHAAVAAGLGWIGINNLLVTPSHGGRVRLATVLTDLPLPAGRPRSDDPPCNGCGACVSLCPAGAIGESLDQFDCGSCFEALKQFRKTHGVAQYICGLCQKACAPRVEMP